MHAKSPAAAEPDRCEDDEALRVVALAKAGWALDDIASDAGEHRDASWVIETLAAHIDCFRPEALN